MDPSVDPSNNADFSALGGCAFSLQRLYSGLGSVYRNGRRFGQRGSLARPSGAIFVVEMGMFLVNVQVSCRVERNCTPSDGFRGG